MKLLILILFPFFCNAQMGGLAANYTSQTASKFGVLVNSETLTNTEKAHIAKDTLGCNWVRGAIVTSQWNGSSSRYEVNEALGLRQSVNFSYYPNASGQPFVTGTLLNNFIDTTLLVLTRYPTVGMVVVQNEELNQSYHTGPITDYCKILQALYPQVHARGFLMADGGVFGVGLDILVYRWLVGKYGQGAADQYGALSMTNGQVNAAKTPNSNPTLELIAQQTDTVLMYKAYVDYFQIHLYEIYSRTNTQRDTITQATVNVVRYQKEYIQETTGKPVITNEVGVRGNTQPSLITSMLAQFLSLSMQYVLWYDGEDLLNGTESLTDVTTGAIKPTGTAFKNYITTHQSAATPILQ